MRNSTKRRTAFLANLSQGKLGEDNATLLGAMLITRIQLTAMSRVHAPEAQRRDFFLYVDEFQNFATDSFAQVLSEARKYRLNLALANQHLTQIPRRTRQTVLGNCGTLISFALGAEDAAMLRREYSDRYLAEDLLGLALYQTINRLAVADAVDNSFPARTLPPDASQTANRLRAEAISRERYAVL